MTHKDSSPESASLLFQKMKTQREGQQKVQSLLSGPSPPSHFPVSCLILLSSCYPPMVLRPPSARDVNDVKQDEEVTSADDIPSSVTALWKEL